MLGEEVTLQPLLTFPDRSWRPDFGSADSNLAVHVCETPDIGASIRKRVEAAAQNGTRVVFAIPQGPVSLAVETQRYLLEKNLEIVGPDPAAVELALYQDFTRMVVAHETLLEPEIASFAISTHLSRARDLQGDDKGKALERAIALASGQIPGWRVRDINFRTSNEELDVVISNNSAKSPWNGTAFVLIEAKNWSQNVDRSEYDAFHMKIKERGGACKLGIFVAATGFSSGFFERASHMGAEHFSIVPVTIDWLLSRLGDERTIEEAFAERVENVVLDRQWEEE